MNRLLTAVLALIALCTLATPAGAVERHELPNGLRVFLVPQRSAPVVTVSVFLPVGRVHEPPHLAGSTHFMEHMLFRATAQRPAGRSEREAWGAGARFTANTWEDFTRYEVALPRERLDLALDLLSDALLTAKFVPEQVEEERRIILEEIAKRNADAELFAWEEADGLTFGPHPYGERIIGTARSVATVTRDQLYDWYRTRYRPEGTALVVAGDFEPAAALEAIRGAFGAWRGKGPRPASPPTPADGFGHYQEMSIVRPGASPMIAVTAPMPDFLHPDYIPARFFAELSRGWLNRRLVGGGRVLTTTVWFAPRLQRNLLRIRLRVAEPADVPAARDALLALLAEFRKPDFPWGGLRKVAGNFRAREHLLPEDLSSLCLIVGRAALGGYYHPDGAPEHLAATDRYDRVAAADVARVAAKYLDPANLRLTVLMPDAAELPPPERSSIASGGGSFRPAGDIARIPWDEVEPLVPASSGPSPRDGDATVTTLPGGATLVYLERTALPVVGVAIIFPSGSERDPVGKEGLASLVLGALQRETKNDPGFELRWRLFSAGDARDFRVTRHVTRAAFSVPREDFGGTLEAVMTMLARPAFSDAAVGAARSWLVARARRARENVGTYAEREFRGAILGPSRTTHSVYGTVPSLTALDADDVRRFHARHLSFGRAVIAVVGDISPRVANATVAEILSRFPSPESDPPAAVDPPTPPKAVRSALTHASGRGYVITGALGPARSSPERPAAEILRLAVGWGVFAEMTERRSIAYEAGPLWLDPVGPTPFGFYVGVQPERIPVAERALAAILDEARADGIDAARFADARGAWLGSFARGRLRSDETAIRLATNLALGRPVDEMERMAAGIRKLTIDDVNRLARKLLAPDRRLTIVVAD